MRGSPYNAGVVYREERNNSISLCPIPEGEGLEETNLPRVNYRGEKQLHLHRSLFLYKREGVVL